MKIASRLPAVHRFLTATQDDPVMRRSLVIGLIVLAALVGSVATTMASGGSEVAKRKSSCGKSASLPQEGEVVASRDGRTLAWSRWAWRPNGDLPGLIRVFVSARDGSGARPVSVPGRGRDAAVALAPDGSQVLIQRDLENTFPMILASTSGAASRFVSGQEEAEIRRRWRTPEWSPDGRFRVVGDRNSLLVVPADGGPPRRIGTTDGFENQNAAWSPDGSRIVFDAVGEFGNSNVYVVGADGSGLRRVATSSETMEPVWSPDGSLIAYSVDATYGHGGYRIGVVRPDGSGNRKTRGRPRRPGPSLSPRPFLDRLADARFRLEPVPQLAKPCR